MFWKDHNIHSERSLTAPTRTTWVCSKQNLSRQYSAKSPSWRLYILKRPQCAFWKEHYTFCKDQPKHSEKSLPKGSDGILQRALHAQLFWKLAWHPISTRCAPDSIYHELKVHRSAGYCDAKVVNVYLYIYTYTYVSTWRTPDSV